ncbi:hypothetical protein J6590_025426 [Homalodisca vitripennis]|nr:hypothetical protein J6590_025426 [Homalodisca vitripennis]
MNFSDEQIGFTTSYLSPGPRKVSYPSPTSRPVVMGTVAGLHLADCAVERSKATVATDASHYRQPINFSRHKYNHILKSVLKERSEPAVAEHASVSAEVD